MSSIVPYGDEVISYLSNNFFNKKDEIAEIVQAYRGISITYLVENIERKTKSYVRDEFLTFVSKELSFIPDFAKCDLTNVAMLKRACIYIHNYSFLFQSSNKFNAFSLPCIAKIALITINRFIIPVNITDPISLEVISKDNLFINDSGQRFSLPTLIEYHNTRDYRGTNGEQYGNKFILNPLTNDFFSYSESKNIIFAAIQSGKELIHLHNHALVPPGMNEPREYESLNHLYLSMKYSLLEMDDTTRRANLEKRNLSKEFIEESVRFMSERRAFYAKRRSDEGHKP